MSAVRSAVPEGETLLLFATSSTVWHARLWQRGLYPRNQVVVVFDPTGDAAIRQLRERYSCRYAVVIGASRSAPPLLRRRDLGRLAGLPDSVSFGELVP